MGPVKRVLLGSTAGIFAVAGAQAADLPVKAAPVEYVRICSLYGAGFWYVPGTDTCIKIGSYVKLQTEYNATNGPFMLGISNVLTGDTGGRFTRTDTAPFTFNNRGMMSFDIRTQTEYGTLRSYFDIGAQTQGADTVAGSGAQGAAVALVSTRAFIQFAGFTVGRIRSFFDIYFQGVYAFAAQRFNADTSANGIVGAAYTWQFGGGLSASFSLEDNSEGNSSRSRSTVNANNNTFGLNTVTTDFKGNEFFDPVFNLRLDQAWGLVGVSAALHDASGGYYTNLPGLAGCPLNNNVEGCGHPGDKFGWAVTAGTVLNNVFGLQGDSFGAQAAYSKGAAGYAAPQIGGSAVFGPGLNLGLGWLVEGVYTNGSNVELTTVWSANAGYEHRWDPKWRTSIYGGIVGVQYDDAAKNMICNSNAVGGLAGGSTIRAAFGGACDPNFSLTEVGSRTLWNPVPDLDVGVDVVWWHLNTSFNGAVAALAQNGAKPAGNNYSVSNQDAVAAIFRIQRNFLY
ncbi:MAG TPA: porin [Xanthobacteraceae bacterium]|nr:porin [Xanthobacteraceae bacterium]